MAVQTYLDFDLLIERAGSRYRARVLSSPGGSASRSFELPFTRDQLQIFVLKAISLGTRRRVRRIESPDMKEIKAFGGQLFESVFDEEVLDCLRLSLHEAERDGAGLRIRLRLDDTVDSGQTDDGSAAALCDVPWEFLYDSSGPGFLCLSSGSPVVRYQDVQKPVERIVVEPPLRLLVVICAPKDAPELDVAHERAKVEESLADLVENGLVKIDWLEKGTLKGLQRQLRSRYHAFHFIGHGGYDEDAGTGVLLFETSNGYRDPVSAEFLRTLFQGHRSLQLAVLNACEGSRTDPTDPFAGVAQSLVRGGVAAVIAMQFEISDDAAIILSSEFYSALAASYPVDAALSEARLAVYTRASAVEWAIPVLYLRSPSASIFDVAALPPRRDEEEEKKEEEKKRTAQPPRIDDTPKVIVKEEEEEEEADEGEPQVEKEEKKSILQRLSRRTKLIAAAALAFIVVVAVAVVVLAGGPLDGKILFVRDGDIFSIDPDTHGVTPLVDADVDANDFAPSVSPDQTQVVFGGGPMNDEDIFIADIEGPIVLNLTDSPGIQEESADWSVDGRIVYDSSDEGGDFEIWSIYPDGSGRQQLTDNTWDDKRPEWSPDASRIAFESIRFGNQDIYVMDANGGNEKPLTDSEAMDGVPVWSLDGTQIAYRSNDGGDPTDYEVWIMGAESGEDPRSVAFGLRTARAPAWSPGGDEIVYSSGVEGNHDLFIVEVGTGNWRPLASSPSDERGPVWCCF
jgi:hypothetical protein